MDDDMSSKSYAFISVPGEVFRRQGKIDQASQRSKLSSSSNRQKQVNSINPSQQGQTRRKPTCVVCNSEKEIGACPTCRSVNCKSCYVSRGRPKDKLCALCVKKRSEASANSERGRQRSRHERARSVISQKSRKTVSAIASCFGKRNSSPDSRAYDFTPPSRNSSNQNIKQEKQKLKENRDDDLKATLRRLRFLRTQRFREMKPIDATNSKLAKEEEKLRAMDAQIGELERGNHVCLARVEQFKNKFCAESARRSHLKTTFVQAGEEIKKLTQKKLESEKLKAHCLKIEHHLQLVMAEIQKLEKELRKLSAQKQQQQQLSRNSSQRRSSQRASVSAENISVSREYSHSRSFSSDSRNDRLSGEWPVLARSVNLESEAEASQDLRSRASMPRSIASSQRSSQRSGSYARIRRDDERMSQRQHPKIAVMRRERHDTSPAQTEMLSSFNTQRLFRANDVFRPMFPMHNRPAQSARSSNHSSARTSAAGEVHAEVRGAHRKEASVASVPKFFRKFLHK